MIAAKMRTEYNVAIPTLSMKKFLILTAVLCSGLVAPTTHAYWINPATYQRTPQEDLCSVLRYTCTRQLRMNETANRALRRHQNYSSLSTPDACVRAEYECNNYENDNIYRGSCAGTCPDGTTYNACSEYTGSDPCRLHRQTEWSNCPTDTVPQRICTDTYPRSCYTACVPARSECVGYCSNGRTYNICTMGPTYECQKR